MGKVHTKYKTIVEMLGLKQLDVYRVREGSRDVDIVRLYDPATRKIIVINLGSVRESISLGDYLAKVLEASSKHGVRISDKKLQTVRESIAKKS
ncbi:MAG: hypothetical protein QXG74_01990 [Acidilobaceae archaeon]